MRRGSSISRVQDLDPGLKKAVVSLLFDRGARPATSDIRAVMAADGEFSISHDPAAGEITPGPGDERWLELLASGLTFDLTGLAPGPPTPLPEHAHSFALAPGTHGSALEAIRLAPGPHLAGGEAMRPVVRTLAWLAARLCALPGIRAVAWHPARNWCSPRHYAENVLRWTDGGPFPGFSLAALAPMADGGLQSEGLALFTGQELRIEPELAEDRVEGAKLALRLLHLLVEHGRMDRPETIKGSDFNNLRLEPSGNGRFVRVWRGQS